MAGPGLFLGRGVERETLLAALERARKGRPGVALITGEAGIGKTRLVEELCSAAGDEVRVAIGESAPDVGPALPYGPFAAALGDDADWLLAGEAGADVLTARHRLFKRVLALLGRLSGRVPLILVLEDLHWADESSRQLLAFLAVSLRDQPLLVVATLREDELEGPAMTWLSELARRPRVQRLRLSGLGDGDIAALAAERLAPRSASGRLAAVVAAADGNPLVAQELAGAGSDALPASIAEAVLSRVAAAPAPVRVVLNQVAVADGPLSHEALADTVELCEEELLEAIRVAVEARLLIPSGDGYAFRHVLTRQAVYTELLPGDRRRLHRRLAETLTARHDRPGVAVRDPSPAELASLAYHWHRAGSGERAAAAALRAARCAAMARAFPEAERLYALVVESAKWLPPDEPAFQILQEAAEAAQWCGQAPLAVDYANRALTHCPPDEPQVRARMQERLGRYLWSAGDAQGAVAARRAAVELLADHPPSPLYARALAAHATGRMLLGEADEATHAARHAISVAVSVGARAEEAHALATLGVLQAQSGELEAGLATMAASFTIAEALGSVEDIVRAAANHTYLLCTAGRFAEALETAQQGRQMAQQRGAPPAATAILDNNMAAVLVATGRWTEAELFVDELLAERPGSVALLHLLKLELAVGMGRRAQVDELAAELTQYRDDPRLMAPLRACLAEQALVHGDPATATREVMAGLAAVRGRVLVEEEARLLAAGCRAVADLAELGDQGLPSGVARGWAQAASTFADRAQRLAATHATGQPDAAAHAAAANAENARVTKQDKRSDWRSVADLWRRAGQPHREAYARLREAESAARAGRREQAGRALAACIALSRPLPAPPLLTLAEALARRARIPLDQEAQGPAMPSAARLDLTDREVQVLGLLSDGDSNRQIARALFISERTVAVHVSHILEKLNVRNRTEAARTAAALDLSPPPAQ